MEVHKHPHHVAHTKKWFEYLLEFVMLFLAVYLGFVAENIREGHVEKEREMQYIKSFYEDISGDQNKLQDLLSFMNLLQKAADTLPVLLKHANIKTPANDIYYYIRQLYRTPVINLYTTDRTYVQLRNSGGMRLIESKQLSDSIISYNKFIESIQHLFLKVTDQKYKFRESVAPLLDGSEYSKVVNSSSNYIIPKENIYLKSNDPIAINNGLLYISDISFISKITRGNVIQLINKAENIKKFISVKYDIK
ncbi:MAG: hypothetical protein NVS3B19_14380 [Ginsengibacter sp.]